MLILTLHFSFLFLLAHLMPSNHLHMATIHDHPTACTSLSLEHGLLLLLSQVLVILVLLLGTVIMASLNVLLIVADLVKKTCSFTTMGVGPCNGTGSRWWQSRHALRLWSRGHLCIRVLVLDARVQVFRHLKLGSGDRVAHGTLLGCS